MNKFIAVTAIWALAVIIGILVMMYGWGLKPVSWGWIIFGGVFGRIMSEIIGIISKGE